MLATGSFSETTNDGVGFGLGFAVLLDPAKRQMPRLDGRVLLGRRGEHRVLDRPVRRADRDLLTQLMPSTTYNFRGAAAQPGVRRDHRLSGVRCNEPSHCCRSRVWWLRRRACWLRPQRSRRRKHPSLPRLGKRLRRVHSCLLHHRRPSRPRRRCHLRTRRSALRRVAGVLPACKVSAFPHATRRARLA